jgi:serine/threonine protein kinase/Tol biopolymer transport system component
MPLTPGTILGQYEIRSPLGAGGMGEVYRAHDTRLDREVAIKVLPESLTSDPDRLRRFEQEARAAAALNHPNILAVYQMATHEGVSYMVSELLEGETLRERLRRGPPLRKTIDYAVQIAHGLAAAHDKGIVHRDLKPENLFVTKDGRVKILDFGLAKLAQPREASGAEATIAYGTESGMVMGTVGYMSPEQVRGKTADHRSDIFAFGTILYEMVTGKQTFRKPTSAETMTAILNEDPPSISQVTAATPPGLQRVVHRCLEKNPEQRFQSASDMAFALEALSDTGMTPSTGSHAHLGEPASRRGIAIAGAILAVLLGVGALAYFWIRPAAVPKVSNYVQLTHDGQPKGLIGTEGSRLFLYVPSGGRSSTEFVASANYQGMDEMSTSGGDLIRMQLPPLSFNSPQPLSLSQDGSELLVMDGHGVPPSGPLWRVPVVGGSPRKLGDIAGQDGAWSADGKFIAYSNGNSLFTAKADGTDTRKVIAVGDSGFIFNPVWSPDGNHLRFMYGATFDAAEYFMEISLDGTGLHRLLPGWTNPPDSECCGAWTADGKYFLFMLRGQIWALPRKAGFLHSEPKPIQLTSSPISLSGPVPSTDGKRLFVIGRTVRGELTRYDLKSGRFEPYLGGISAEYVSFSKDGQWVAYVSFPEGTLWRSKMDGSERLQLTYPPSQALMPRWSPDGKTIVFFGVDANQRPRIYEVSLEGGSLRPLMPNNPDPQTDPNWSPDGSKIVFAGHTADATSSIRVFDLATRQVSTLPGSQGMYSPRWSTDGRYIPALSVDSKRLLLFDFQTQKWTELAQGRMGWLEWSKDGQYLQANDASGTGAIIRIRLSDHKTERVVDLKNFATAGFYGFWLAVAPDDSPIMLRDAGTQDVYALDWEEP